MPALTRRKILKLAVTGAAGAATLAVTAAHRQAFAQPGGAAAIRDASEEIYKSRQIRVFPATGPGQVPSVFIDGRPLHVMVTRSGQYVSAVNHYRAADTGVEAGRLAVDVLGSRQLRPGHHHN
jgi:hypothetical protein